MSFRLVNDLMEKSAARVPFERAGIAVDKLEEFEQLRSALTRVFAPAAVEDFLRLLRRKGVPIRDFDRVLREGLLEHTDRALGQNGKAAEQLYRALTVSDQAQVRELYLTMLEAVDLSLREKYKKLYRYY